MKLGKIIRTRSINETSKDFHNRMVDLLTCVNEMYVNQETEWTMVCMYSSPIEIADCIFQERYKK